jgi:DNA mismatch repair protein MutL
MSIIKILPEHLVNQIAAGEVIERPSSVVKELLENSIDAKATEITLEVVGAGDELIKVTDNGTGMDSTDAKLAFERHATSKINSQEDLFNIWTMGFRGEAIASIASVSLMSLQSKRKEDSVGTKIETVAGAVETLEECSCNNGTSIEVKNLFFNTPARKKYLKSLSTEYQAIVRLFQNIALINPTIHFKLVHDNKLVADYPKSEALIERINSTLGKHTAENCIPIFYESSEISIDGFIGKPELARKGSRHQHLYVNGRPITHSLFSYALTDSYHSLLMDGKKPFFVININIAPDLIDVNVHPRKLEIRFINQSHLFAIFKKAATKTLEKNVLMPSFTMHEESFDLDTNGPAQSAAPFVYDHSRPAQLNKYSYKKEDEKEPSMMPIAQIAKSYILAENEEGLILIDQHAAHERVRFEELMNEFEKSQPQKQQLLLPLTIEFSTLECEIFNQHQETFAKLGFEIELFGKNTFIVQSVPSIIARENIEQVILNVMSDLSDDKQTHAVKDPQEKVIEYMSCRSAIKFGKDLSIDEMMELIRQLDTLKRPYTCPHGRPSMVKLSFDELEKRFKRK